MSYYRNFPQFPFFQNLQCLISSYTLEADSTFDQATVYIEPPLDSEDTDGDSDEEDADDAVPSNLNRN